MTMREAEQIARRMAALAREAGASVDVIHRTYYDAIASALMSVKEPA